MPDRTTVDEIFESVSPRYDLANRILSLGLDLRWRRQAVLLAEIGEGMRVMDLCCGSGDMAFSAVSAVGTRGYVCGYDSVEAMLERARAKWETMYRKYHFPKELAEFKQGDCEKLNRPDRLFDAATCAFGIRNATNISRFIESTCGNLRRGGKVVILEFSLPRNFFFRMVALGYLIIVVPILGWMITGKLREYRYLSDSIRTFSRDIDLSKMLMDAKFTNVRAIPLSGGIVTVYVGEKSTFSQVTSPQKPYFPELR
ncbi:MAG: ubiquinone/menaquinone biosynthesis methyltransferase [Phycisphaerae bacterium]|nr:ubiquinone/menaquinone biosynthesis methyltransferase [Phycisphaerae bacterium]